MCMGCNPPLHSVIDLVKGSVTVVPQAADAGSPCATLHVAPADEGSSPAVVFLQVDTRVVHASLSFHVRMLGFVVVCVGSTHASLREERVLIYRYEYSIYRAGLADVRSLDMRYRWVQPRYSDRCNWGIAGHSICCLYESHGFGGAHPGETVLILTVPFRQADMKRIT